MTHRITDDSPSPDQDSSKQSRDNQSTHCHTNGIAANTLQNSSAAPKSGLSSAGQTQTCASIDGLDPVSIRNTDSTYPMTHHQRQSSPWTSNPTYSDIASPYNSHQRSTYQPQPPILPSRMSPNLPPIRDIDRLERITGYEGNYPSSVSPYPQPYGGSTGPHGGQETYPFTAERQSYYDSPQRYGQGYPPTNRPHAPQIDYSRYPLSPYEPYRTGVHYHSAYGPIDYAPSPTGLQHPSSPTVGMDSDRARRRRGNLPRQITEILRAWFHEHLDHPYPSEEDKQAFMARTGLTISQVCLSSLLTIPLLIRDSY